MSELKVNEERQSIDASTEMSQMLETPCVANNITKKGLNKMIFKNLRKDVEVK